MLENLHNARQRWGGVNEIIDRWLKERQELLVGYCALSEAPDTTDAPERLQSTCQILVDYISAGHFEIYERLINEAKDFEDSDALREAESLYQTIDATTEEILDFNDKYLETDDLTSIVLDLSKLGEILATRFEAEDRMIEVLHSNHETMLN